MIKLKSLITEEINKAQLISTAKILNVEPKFLKAWIEQTDVTPRKSFSVWILKGLKSRDVRLEDAHRIRTALLGFIRLKNAGRIEDITQFPNLNSLENRIEGLVGVGSKRKGFANVNPETLPGVTVIKKTPHLVFYKVINADSLSKVGEGTKWCTRFSYKYSTDIAKQYLKDNDYLIVIYKDGKPYGQYLNGIRQLKNVEDRPFTEKEKDIIFHGDKEYQILKAKYSGTQLQRLMQVCKELNVGFEIHFSSRYFSVSNEEGDFGGGSFSGNMTDVLSTIEEAAFESRGYNYHTFDWDDYGIDAMADFDDFAGPNFDKTKTLSFNYP